MANTLINGVFFCILLEGRASGESTAVPVLPQLWCEGKCGRYNVGALVRLSYGLFIGFLVFCGARNPSGSRIKHIDFLESELGCRCVG